MNDLYRRGDLNAFGMQVVNDGEYAYPLAAEYLDALIESGALVLVDPVRREWRCGVMDFPDAYCNPENPRDGGDCDSRCGWYLMVKEGNDE